MPVSPNEHKRLLKAAFKRTGKPVKEIIFKLADICCSGNESLLHNWRYKATNISQDYLLCFCRQLVLMGGFQTREQLKEYLATTDYQYYQEFVDEVFPLGKNLIYSTKSFQRRLYDNLSTSVGHLKHDLKQVVRNRPRKNSFFTGRQGYIEKIIANLKPGVVYTIYGMPGCGKTSLISEVAWTLMLDDVPPKQFPNGIVYVDLREITSIDSALRVIVSKFDPDIFFREPEILPVEAAQKVLPQYQFLLILDSVEMVPKFRSIFQLCGDNCGVLVASRHKQDIWDEGQEIDLVSLDEAVSIINRWGGETRVGGYNTAKELCRQVDRLPLAVEILGRKLSMLNQTGAELLEELQQSPLHALNFKDNPEQSIHILLTEYSAQLPQTYRDILAVVGLLAYAPFEQEMIVKALELSPMTTREALGKLVGFHWLDKDRGQYSIHHALMYDFTRELEISYETINNLVEYLYDKAPDNDDLLSEVRLWLDSTWRHYRSVFDKCYDQKHFKELVFLASSLSMYFDFQGYWSEAEYIYESTIRAARILHLPEIESMLLFRLGSTQHVLLQPHLAIQSHHHALAIDREIGSKIGEAGNLCSLGNVYRGLGQVSRAKKYYQQALEICRKNGFRRDEAACLSNIGSIFLTLGDTPQAIGQYQQALAINQETGHRRNQATVIGHLGDVYYSLGQYEESAEYYQQALKIGNEIGYRKGTAFYLLGLGRSHYQLEELALAQKYLEQAFDIVQDLGEQRLKLEILHYLAKAYNGLGQIEQSIDFNQQALNLANHLGQPQTQGDILCNLGSAYWSAGQKENALTYYQRSLETYQVIDDRQSECAVLSSLGLFQIENGQLKKAASFFQQSLVIAQEIENQSLLYTSLSNLGTIYLDLGNIDRAIWYLEMALDSSQAKDSRDNAGYVLSKLGTAYRLLKEFEQAVDYYDQSLHITREFSDLSGEAYDLIQLGETYEASGKIEQAITCYQRAREIYSELGRVDDEIWILVELGRTYKELGIVSKTSDGLEQALMYFEQAKILWSNLENSRAIIGDIDKHIGDVYEGLGEIHGESEYIKKATQSYERALTAYKEINNRLRIGHILVRLGIAYANLQEYERSVTCLTQGHSICQEAQDWDKAAYLLGILSTVHIQLGQAEQAVKFGEQALVIYHQLGDQQSESTLLIQLATILRQLGQWQRAKEKYLIALSVTSELSNPHIEANALTNLGQIFEKAEQNWERALYYYQRSLEVHKQINNENSKLFVLNRLIQVHSKAGQLEKAVSYGQQSLKLLSSNGDPTAIASTQATLGKLYLDLKQIDKAKKYLREAFRIFKTFDPDQARLVEIWLKSTETSNI